VQAAHAQAAVLRRMLADRTPPHGQGAGAAPLSLEQLLMVSTVEVEVDEAQVRPASPAASPVLDGRMDGRVRTPAEWTWWAHTGGGNALAFKQRT
jgi:hypothetical protein